MENYTYTKVEPTELDKGMIIREDSNGDIWYIPIEPANSDYQAYLAAQSTPSVE
jgi:hypothetical protein